MNERSLTRLQSFSTTLRVKTTPKQIIRTASEESLVFKKNCSFIPVLLFSSCACGLKIKKAPDIIIYPCAYVTNDICKKGHFGLRHHPRFLHLVDFLLAQRVQSKSVQQ